MRRHFDAAAHRLRLFLQNRPTHFDQPVGRKTQIVIRKKNDFSLRRRKARITRMGKSRRWLEQIMRGHIR